MKINSVALMGAGAIGAYFINGLSGREDIDFAVIADGERAARLRSEGIVINQQTFYPRVKTPSEAHGADLLIISTKYDGLKSALGEIREAVGPETLVMSVLNGVDSESIVGEAIGMEHMVYSFMRVISRRVGREIALKLSPGFGVIVGEPGKSEPTERIRAIEELFKGTSVNCFFSPDIEEEMWSKYMINVSGNLPQAVIGVGAGAYVDSPYFSLMHKRLVDEVVAVAAAKGIRIDPGEAVIKVDSARSKASRYSTLQDIDASRHTEIEMFAGVLVSMGEELGVPTPYTECMYLFIKTLEEKMDGKFDYLAAADGK